MSCCRSSRNPAPPRAYDRSTCTNCNLDLLELFKQTALHQTRGQLGSRTLLVRINCPKCNAVNAYKVNVDRKADSK